MYSSSWRQDSFGYRSARLYQTLLLLCLLTLPCTANAIDLTQADFPLTISGSGLEYDLVEDIVFTGTGDAIHFDGCTAIVLRGNGHKITGNSDGQIVDMTSASNVRIESIVLLQDSESYAIWIRSGSTDIRFENTLVMVRSSSLPLVRVREGCADVAIVGSTLLHFGTGPAVYTRQAPPDRLGIHNCLLRSDASYAFQSLRGEFRGLSHSHNGFSRTDGGFPVLYAGEVFDDGQLLDDSSFSTDFEFVNDTGTPDGDYRLADGSHALDRGSAEFSSLDQDLEGSPRITGYAVDVGAFEHPIGATNFASVPGIVEARSTIHCAGFRWYIDGDANLDCTVGVQWRRVGTAIWKDAQSLHRIESGDYNGHGVTVGNLLAGSIFGLEADTEYEVQLLLEDPDGGDVVEAVVVRTRAFPVSAPGSRVRYVAPGDGGGSGTLEDPFRGVGAADMNASPGDVFLLQPGSYVGTHRLQSSGLTDHPIVWRGLDRNTVILDGEALADSVLVLSDVSHVHLESLHLRRARSKLITGTNTNGVVIRDCILDSSELLSTEMWGVHLRDPGNHANCLLVGNEIVGPLTWEDGRPSDDHYGIAIVGEGHVVAHNDIHGWYDGVRLQDSGTDYLSFNCDVYGNEIYDCVDDGVEVDGSSHNVRVFENRITNCLTGLSAQPVYGGPAYFVRNVVYNWQLKPLKWQVWPTGLVAHHNTFVGAGPRGWGDGNWRNGIVRNNLFIGGSTTNSSDQTMPLATSAIYADLDYNGWYQHHPDRFAIFNLLEYEDLETFFDATGMENHGVLVGVETLVAAEEPPLGSYLGQEGFPPAYVPGSQDLTLANGSPAVDAGVPLPGINDGFEGLAPDLGAYELGHIVPIYGLAGSGTASVEPPPHDKRPGLVAYPNPSRSQFVFEIFLPAPGHVEFAVHDAAGRLVRRWRTGGRPQGTSEIEWDGTDSAGRLVTSGVYMVSLQIGRERRVCRTVLVR